MSNRRKLRRVIPALGLSGALVAGLVVESDASSHREAPLITEDPVADLTDVYAFVDPNDSSMVTLIMNVNPLSQPAGGPNFHKFGDDVLYQFNVDSNGNGKADYEYEFRFTTKVNNPNTFLYNTGQVTSLTDADLNVMQTYTVTEVDNTHRSPRRKTLAHSVPVAPANVGERSTPNYEANLGVAAIKPLTGGGNVFAGPRDDPFFVDLGRVFDLGSLGPFLPAHLIPGAADPGEDYVAGTNVHTIAVQIPKTRLTSKYGDPNIGVWATTYRKSTQLRRSNGTTHFSGSWRQVSRLGMPLVNEVVIPMGQKDRFNASEPHNDLQFAGSVLNPELGALIPVLYPGVTVPASVDAGLGLGGREDLATIFVTGIPGVNKSGLFSRPSEMIRLNTSTASGFPNGRLLADDVTDVSLRAVAGGIGFPGTEAFNIAPNNALGDGVAANDKPFKASFPYVAEPWSGTD